jgi:hypothetical protein
MLLLTRAAMLEKATNMSLPKVRLQLVYDSTIAATTYKVSALLKSHWPAAVRVPAAGIVPLSVLLPL